MSKLIPKKMKTKLLNLLTVIGTAVTVIIAGIHVANVMASPIDQPADRSALPALLVSSLVTITISAIPNKH